MRPDRFLAFFLLLISLPAIAERDCSAYQSTNEKKLIQHLKKQNFSDNRSCLSRDLVAEEGMTLFKNLVQMIPRVRGLPKDLIVKWEKFSWEHIQFISTDINLCLESHEEDCSQDSILVAKNYPFKKKGFILINNSEWNSLKKIQKYSIVFHEVLSIMGYEKNSYEYSSMLEFVTKCEDTGCYIWARSHL